MTSIKPIAIIAAALLAAPASAATVPERIKVHGGVYQFVDPEALTSRFGPPEGLDVIYGPGKTGHLQRAPYASKPRRHWRTNAVDAPWQGNVRDEW